MKIIFTKCKKITDNFDVSTKTRFVRSTIDTINGGLLLVEFCWPDFTIENEEGDILTVSDKTLSKIKRVLGAEYFTIIS